MGNGHCLVTLQGEKVKYMIMKTNTLAFVMLFGISGMMASCMTDNKKSTEMKTIELTQEWDKTFPQSDKVEHSKIIFHNRYGITLAADVYKPKNRQGTLAAIAVSGPYGAVKEQVSGRYAQTLADRGFLTIAFDPSFYGESGGQTGDTGVIKTDNATLEVTATGKTPDGVVLHIARFISGDSIALGDKVHAQIDVEKREATRRNHTAAHLLQAALRKHLGSHVEQAGQLVNSEEMRFDFTHFSALSGDELKAIEREVNEVILKGITVETREMPIEEAKKLGAMALFGEKYGDVVRVVSAGDFSVELCGGTHADNTAKLGLFKIVSESSVAAGIRRITAVTGFGVLKHIENDERIMQSAAAAMKLGNVAELDKRAATLAAEVKAKDRELAELRSEISALKAGSLMDSARQVGGVRLITAEVEVSNPGELRSMCDTARDNGADIVAVFAGVNKEKGTLNFACACGADAIKLGAHAGNIVRETAKIAGGSGGGKPDSAMAGAKDASKADEALAAVDSIVSAMLK